MLTTKISWAELTISRSFALSLPPTSDHAGRLRGTIGFDGNQSPEVDPIYDRFLPSRVDGGHRFGNMMHPIRATRGVADDRLPKRSSGPGSTG